MYDEDEFKSLVFWLKVKRLFILLILAIIGCVIGFFLSAFLIEVLMMSTKLRVLLITGCTIVFFVIGLLLTSGTAMKVQETYWRIAVLRKMTLISKKLDALQGDTNISNIPSSAYNVEEEKPERESKKSKKSSAKDKTNKAFLDKIKVDPEELNKGNFEENINPYKF